MSSKQHANMKTNVDPDLSRIYAALGQDELSHASQIASSLHCQFVSMRKKLIVQGNVRTWSNSKYVIFVPVCHVQ